MTRQEMIRKMNRHELEFLISNPDYLEIVTNFFTEGGYTVYSNEQLTNIWKTKFEETENA